MADVPDKLTLRRHRDLEGRRRDIVIRRVIIGVLTVFVLAGLLNAFGQRPTTAHASGPVADLSVYAPIHVRGGLYFEARFRIDAKQDIAHATLVLDPGWFEGITANTTVPGAVAETSRNGRVAFDLGHIPAGNKHLFFIQLQVNPTNVGRRSQDVELDDGETPLLHVDRTITVFP